MHVKERVKRKGRGEKNEIKRAKVINFFLKEYTCLHKFEESEFSFVTTRSASLLLPVAKRFTEMVESMNSTFEGGTGKKETGVA